MVARWETGVWLGTRQKSDEHWAGLEDGRVESTKTIRLVKLSERLNADFVFFGLIIKGCPW